MDSTDNMAVMGAEETAITLLKFGHGFSSTLTQREFDGEKLAKKKAETYAQNTHTQQSQLCPRLYRAWRLPKYSVR